MPQMLLHVDATDCSTLFYKAIVPSARDGFQWFLIKIAH